MYTLFILFFASLVSITFMIGRKLAPVRNGEIVEPQHAHPFVPDVEKIKNLAYRGLKKYEHLTLVSIVTFYIRSSNFAKSQYQKLIGKIQSMRKQKTDVASDEPKEQNKFLSMISDYKHRIRHIKHTIKEEEENK